MAAATHPSTPVTLSGARKGAVLCLALGPDGAAKILQQLSAEEVESITREIAALPTVPSDVVAAVLQEFHSASRSPSITARGGADVAFQVAEQALGASRAKGVVDRIRNAAPESQLRQLKKAAPDVLAGILRSENPQTIALVLAHLEPQQAAAVAAALEPALASEVLYRVARMDKVSPDMLAAVETALSGKTDLSLSQDAAASGGPAAVARVLNLAGGELGRQVLESIGQLDGDVAASIKSLMFVFEDLLLIDGRGIQRLLREVDTKELALALKAASDELRQHIKSNMSERAAGALDEEIEMMGPVRVKDVQAAHSRIVEQVRALEDSGEILIAGRGGNDDVIA